MRFKIVVLMVFICSYTTVLCAQTMSVKVTNAVEFFSALGNNRVIECAPGVYSVKDARTVVNEFVTWKDANISYGENKAEPQIAHLRNVKIIAPQGVTFLNGRQSGYVLNFYDCSNIQLIGITAGHDQGNGECWGGVLLFENSTEIALTKCNLFGSGINGISLIRCVNVEIIDSMIFDCTRTLATMYGCEKITFKECQLNKSGKGEQNRLVEISESLAVDFIDCLFERNRTTNYIFKVDAFSKDIALKKCTFKDNTFSSMSDNNAFPVQDNVIMVATPLKKSPQVQVHKKPVVKNQKKKK